MLLDELVRLGVVEKSKEGDVELLVSAFVPQKDRKQRLFWFGRDVHDRISPRASTISWIASRR